MLASALASTFSSSVPLPFVRFTSVSSYSAFCSSFQLSPLLPHSGFPGAQFRSRFPVLLRSLRLISQASFPDSLTRLRCPFPFVLSCFAPAAVPQVIPFQISPPGSVPDFRFLSSASVLASHYSASASSFPALPGFTSQWFSRCPAPLSLPLFPLPFHPVSRASLPVLSTRLPFRFLSPFLASLPQLFHECLPSFRFLSSPYSRHLSVPPRFLSSAFGFPSQLLSFLALPFRFFPHSPRASSFGAPALLSLRRSPLPSALLSHGFRPIPLTRFSASFSFILPGSSPAADFPVLALLSASSRPLLP